MSNGRTREEQEEADRMACEGLQVLCREALRTTRDQARAREFLNDSLTFFTKLLRVVIDGHLREHNRKL
jgi:hypothetical protein